MVDEPLKALILLSGILRQKNMNPSFVNNLASARQSLQQETPSVLFLDNHLPDGFGLDFIQYVKSSYPEIKIIMITAHDGLAERKKAKAEGADLFISKPFTRDVIDYALREILVN
jgi:two-component system OmpR family response regulator